MTVAELIAKLREMPGDMPVVVQNEWRDETHYDDPEVSVTKLSDEGGEFARWREGKPAAMIAVIR